MLTIVWKNVWSLNCNYIHINIKINFMKINLKSISSLRYYLDNPIMVQKSKYTFKVNIAWIRENVITRNHYPMCKDDVNLYMDQLLNGEKMDQRIF